LPAGLPQAAHITALQAEEGNTEEKNTEEKKTEGKSKKDGRKKDKGKSKQEGTYRIRASNMENKGHFVAVPNANVLEFALNGPAHGKFPAFASEWHLSSLLESCPFG
jgi:hypothetical protein